MNPDDRVASLIKKSLDGPLPVPARRSLEEAAAILYAQQPIDLTDSPAVTVTFDLEPFAHESRNRNST